MAGDKIKNAQPKGEKKTKRGDGERRGTMEGVRMREEGRGRREGNILSFN